MKCKKLIFILSVTLAHQCIGMAPHTTAAPKPVTTGKPAPTSSTSTSAKFSELYSQGKSYVSSFFKPKATAVSPQIISQESARPTSANYSTTAASANRSSGSFPAVSDPQRSAEIYKQNTAQSSAQNTQRNSLTKNNSIVSTLKNTFSQSTTNSNQPIQPNISLMEQNARTLDTLLKLKTKDPQMNLNTLPDTIKSQANEYYKNLPETSTQGRRSQYQGEGSVNTKMSSLKTTLQNELTQLNTQLNAAKTTSVQTRPNSMRISTSIDLNPTKAVNQPTTQASNNAPSASTIKTQTTAEVTQNLTNKNLNSTRPSSININRNSLDFGSIKSATQLNTTTTNNAQTVTTTQPQAKADALQQLQQILDVKILDQTLNVKNTPQIFEALQKQSEALQKFNTNLLSTDIAKEINIYKNRLDTAINNQNPLLAESLVQGRIKTQRELLQKELTKELKTTSQGDNSIILHQPKTISFIETSQPQIRTNPVPTQANPQPIINQAPITPEAYNLGSNPTQKTIMQKLSGFITDIKIKFNNKATPQQTAEISKSMQKEAAALPKTPTSLQIKQFIQNGIDAFTNLNKPQNQKIITTINPDGTKTVRLKNAQTTIDLSAATSPLHQTNRTLVNQNNPARTLNKTNTQTELANLNLALNDIIQAKKELSLLEAQRDQAMQKWNKDKTTESYDNYKLINTKLNNANAIVLTQVQNYNALHNANI